jgi:hypothetical protein
MPEDQGPSGHIVPLGFNKSQLYLHQRLEEQRQKTGMVRAILLKGRQAGFSTYIGGRFYHRTSLNRGVETFILTHEQPPPITCSPWWSASTSTPRCGPQPAPPTPRNSGSTSWTAAIAVGTAGSTAIGRSKTIQLFHGSEVAFWKNAQDHFRRRGPDHPAPARHRDHPGIHGHGPGGEFHERWQQAEAGHWGLSGNLCALVLEPRISPSGASRLRPRRRRAEYAEQCTAWTLEQMAWRRSKMEELKDPLLFKQEYPATADEAFQATGHDSFIKPELILRARKNTVTGIGPAHMRR